MPQGYVLGPLLFTIFINDLPNYISDCKMMLHADDTTMYYSHSSVVRLMEVLDLDIHRMTSWFQRNGLKVIVKKTQFMNFSKKCRKKEANRVEVRMEGVVLKSSEEVKYLGVTVDWQLTWKEHIDRIRIKCISGLSLLYKVKSALPLKMKKQLFELLIQPHLDYCAVVLAECSKESATKLERIQKAGMRMILNIHQRDFPSAVMRCKLG